MVKEFRDAFNLETPVTGTDSDRFQNIKLQAKLITSEAIEFLAAVDEGNEVEQYDAIVDMLYVWYGMALSTGLYKVMNDDDWITSASMRLYPSLTGSEDNHLVDSSGMRTYLPAIDIIYIGTTSLSVNKGQLNTGLRSARELADYYVKYHEMLIRIYEKISTLIAMIGMSHDLLDSLFREVHRSNMSKLDIDGKPVYNIYGKVIKSSNYTPPVLEPIIEKLG